MGPLCMALAVTQGVSSSIAYKPFLRAHSGPSTVPGLAQLPKSWGKHAGKEAMTLGFAK